jgi:4-amino-4-deoxy-L-arabinose transferase-like glycosyltransferase
MINLSFFQNRGARVIFILALALAARLAGIASRPIWYDESFSLLIAEQGPAAILHGTLAADADSSAAEEHPPAYYFMLWGWMQIFGSSLIAARVLSIIASLGIVFLVYKIAEHLDPAIAQTAGILAAILPFQIHYGQEIRMYVFMTLWICLALYAFFKRKWILFAAAAALAQYTHNMSAFYLIAIALMPLLQRDWKSLRALTWSGFAALVLYAPWLIQLPAQFAKITNNFWIEKPGAEKFFTMLLVYLPHLPLSNYQMLIGFMFAALVFALAVYQTLRAKIPSQERAKGLWMAYFAFFPPLVIWLVSQWRPIYIERALLPSHAVFCIWLAWTTRAKMPRAVFHFASALVLVSAGIGMYQHLTYTGFPYAPFQATTEMLRESFQDGDVIIHANKNTRLPSAYYAPDLPQEYIADPTGSNLDTLSPATQRMLNLVAQSSIESASQNAQRVWLVVFQRHIDRYKEIGYEDHPHLIYLFQHFNLEKIEERDDLRIYLFTK